MLSRHALAAVRGPALALLGLAGFLVSLLGVVAATLVLPYPLAADAMIRLRELNRRLAGRWGGVVIDAPPRTVAPRPERRDDGWYAQDGRLYRSPVVPAFLLRLRWLGQDKSLAWLWYWLVLTPFTGGLATLVPPALIVGGPVAAVRLLPGTAAPLAVAVPAVALGFALAPAMLRLHARWIRLALRPPELSWWRTSGVGPWLSRRWQAAWLGGGLAGLSFAAFGGFSLNVLAAAASWGGLIPVASGMTRRLVANYRRLARRWTGADLPDPYRPPPAPPERDGDGDFRVGRGLYAQREAAERAQRIAWIRGDPATWRDLLWMALAPAPSVLGLVPAALLCLGFFGLIWQVLWWPLWAVPLGLATGNWVTPWYVWLSVTGIVPGLDAAPEWVSVPIGLGLTAAGLLLALPLLRLRTGFDRLLLNPTRSALLAQRVQRLTETRADAVDARAAELRRIERDLHDGAQARLVAVGLGLAAVERLIESDPDTARRLVAQARQSSATALTELRDLVRGIHPPVLAERGLADAVRAVALDTPLPVEVTGTLDARLDPAVESAAYFAVCEALTNAVRHARAQRVTIVLRHRDDLLTITVTDDGCGGADAERGSGLRGLRRRLGTFDGVLVLRSPRGGPTVLTMEIPCASSSPKTSTS
jgi:signal transduction histidine kinase